MLTKTEAKILNFIGCEQLHSEGHIKPYLDPEEAPLLHKAIKELHKNGLIKKHRLENSPKHFVWVITAKGDMLLDC